MLDSAPSCMEIDLKPADQARYDRNVASFLSEAVAQYSAQSGHIDEAAWIHVRRRQQLSIYKSVQGTRDPRVTLFKGTGLIHGPVQDVMDGLYCDTTDDLRACKTLLKYKLVDGRILNVTERRSHEVPYRFAGIKWFAAKAAWGLSKHRDVLAYERMGTTTDARGKELAYHVLHSIDHPAFPIDAIKGIKREHQVTCFLYRNYDNCQVECFIWSTVYNLDFVAQRMAEYVVAGTLLNVTDCVNSARAKKYSMLIKQAQHSKWPANSICHICYGRSFISTNRPCAGCFQSVCRACSDYRFIFHIDAKTGRPHQQRFCKLCINNTVIIDSQSFEASIQKRPKDLPVDVLTTSMKGRDFQVVRGAPQPGASSCHNVLKCSAMTIKSSQSTAETSLRSNYLDWASDWSSQDDDDDEYLHERLVVAGQERTKRTSKRSGMVSLSDLTSEDKFSPYPAAPQAHKPQSEGRNNRVRENRVHQKKHKMLARQEMSDSYQSPLDLYAGTSSSSQWPHQSALLLPFRSPYKPLETKRQQHSGYMSSDISSDSEDGDDVHARSMTDPGLGLSKFDLGIVNTTPVDEFDDDLGCSMYSDDGDRPQIRRHPRYGRTSHADKDGFLSDLYSLSRSRIHGQH
uniref:FYVE-type domain-containing protein n=1 Tax=Hyaloperonospora arabidopsidis (strain Emoy2) TaxID=559515 RepID=M4BLT6_HYAAE